MGGYRWPSRRPDINVLANSPAARRLAQSQKLLARNRPGTYVEPVIEILVEGFAGRSGYCAQGLASAACD